MSVYGFNNKTTAEKLSRFVRSGGAGSGSMADINTTDDTSIVFKNTTGGTIPPYGIVFASGDESYAGTPAVGTVKFDEATDEEKRFPIFNSGAAVANNAYGVSQSADGYHTAISDEPSTFDLGDTFYASSTDYLLTKTVTSGPKFYGAIPLDHTNVGTLATYNPLLVKPKPPSGGGGGSVFPVSMTQTGGAQGDELGPATWSYTVVGPEDGDNMTAVNPVTSPHLFKRPNIGQMSKATAGLATRDENDDMVVYWCNEAIIGVTCEEEV